MRHSCSNTATVAGCWFGLYNKLCFDWTRVRYRSHSVFSMKKKNIFPTKMYSNSNTPLRRTDDRPTSERFYDFTNIGERAVLSTFATLWTARSPSPSAPDIRCFCASDLEVVYGHACVLSAASPILASIIHKTIEFELENEYDKNEKKKLTIPILDVDSATLTEVFRFIYTGKVEDLRSHQISLLAASEKFHLNSLRTVCALSIRQSLPPEQAHYLLTRMPLNQLPDLCLLMVFDHLPVKQLFPLSTVCKRWRSLLKPACNRRRALTLFGASAREVLLYSLNLSPLEIPYQDEMTSEGHDDELDLVDLTVTEEEWCTALHAELYQRLATIWFPGLTRLRLGLVNVNKQALSALAGMFATTTHYGQQLTSLDLNLALTDSVTATELRILFLALEHAAVLTELTLLCRVFERYSSSYANRNQLLQPPVIGSLRSLTYHCSFPFHIALLRETLCLEMPGLTHLALYCPPTDYGLDHNHLYVNGLELNDRMEREPYRELAGALPERVWSNLGVVLHYERLQLQLVHHHHQPFAGLRSLVLTVTQEPSVVRVMASLAYLRHTLVHLELNLNAPPRARKSTQPESHDLFEVVEPEALPNFSFPVLSVLELWPGSDTPLREPYVPSARVLATIAPHLSVLTLDLYQGFTKCPDAEQHCPRAVGPKEHWVPYITRAHVPCIRPIMEAVWSGGTSGGGTTPLARPLPQLRRLMIRLFLDQDFDHWPDILATSQ